MTIQEIAKKLDGMEYLEDTPSIFDDAKNSGIIVVYGASDDLMEFRGAIYDEAGVFDGGKVYITKDEILLSPDCECEYATKWYDSQKKEARSIEAIWCGSDPEASWSYKTDIPHVTFRIMEDGDVYCYGIVFQA
jgi:hypothetical protein